MVDHLELREEEAPPEPAASESASAKEALLAHLAARFDAIARDELKNLTDEQAGLVRKVRLQVHVQLSFTPLEADADDDSEFPT